MQNAGTKSAFTSQLNTRIHRIATGDAGGAAPAPRATAEGFDPNDAATQGEHTALRQDEVSVRRETSEYDV